MMFIFQFLYRNTVSICNEDNINLSAQETAVGTISSPMSTNLQSPFEPQFSGSHLMKLFPGGCPSMTGMTPPVSHQASSPANLFRATNNSTPGSLQTTGGAGGPTYPAEFSNYGPMYSSYYAKQAQAMVANHPSAR